MTVKKNILLIVIFIFAVLTLFINKLTSPRVLSTNELLINGLFLFEAPKEISDFTFLSSNKDKPFPPIDESLLQALDTLFPEQSAEVDWKMEEVMFKAGQRSDGLRPLPVRLLAGDEENLEMRLG